MRLGILNSVLGLAISCVSVSADCNGVPQVENASANVTGTSSYPVGTVLQYSCNVGYTTTGTSRFYTCSGTEWTGGNVRCEEIYCPHIAPPDNGIIVNQPTNQVGTNIIFACNEGHDMTGSSLLLCRTDGNWSPPTAPTCTPKNCGDFGSVPNGNTFQDNSQFERNHYGSVTVVTCHEGYILNGSSRVECQANGAWGLKPTCVKTACPPYPNTYSACVGRVSPFGSHLIIICKEGDNVSVTQTGDGFAECLSSGQWNSMETACFCDCYVGSNKATVEFTNLNNKQFLPHNQSLQWKCPSGTKRTLIACCIDGKFHVTTDGTDVTYNTVNGVISAVSFCERNSSSAVGSTCSVLFLIQYVCLFFGLFYPCILQAVFGDVY